jgi:hypothetical protein
MLYKKPRGLKTRILRTEINTFAVAVVWWSPEKQESLKNFKLKTFN